MSFNLPFFGGVLVLENVTENLLSTLDLLVERLPLGFCALAFNVLSDISPVKTYVVIYVPLLYVMMFLSEMDKVVYFVAVVHPNPILEKGSSVRLSINL